MSEVLPFGAYPDEARILRKRDEQRREALAQAARAFQGVPQQTPGHLSDSERLCAIAARAHWYAIGIDVGPIYELRLSEDEVVFLRTLATHLEGATQ